MTNKIRNYFLTSSTSLVFFIVGASQILRLLTKYYIQLNSLTLPFILLVEIIAEVTISAWLFSIVTGFNSTFSTDRKFNLVVFYLAIGLNILFPFFNTFAFNYIIWLGISDYKALAESLYWRTIELSSLLAPLYCIYLTGRVLIRIENYQNNKFLRSAFLYIQLWLYPIGIILLQPRCRHLNQTYRNSVA